jgi:hypothetical protein
MLSLIQAGIEFFLIFYFVGIGHFWGSKAIRLMSRIGQHWDLCLERDQNRGNGGRIYHNGNQIEWDLGCFVQFIGLFELVFVCCYHNGRDNRFLFRDLFCFFQELSPIYWDFYSIPWQHHPYILRQFVFHTDISKQFSVGSVLPVVHPWVYRQDLATRTCFFALVLFSRRCFYTIGYFLMSQCIFFVGDYT